MRLPQAGPAQQVAARAVRAELIGDQPLVGLARPEQHRAGAVAEEREALLVAGIDHPAVAISADHQRALAVARADELRRDHQREDETRTRRLHVERRAGQLELVLHQVRGRGECHVGRERRQDQQVDIARLAARRLRQRMRRLGAEVAGRLVRQREPPLMDARPVDDPFRVEAVGALEVVVADDQLGDVAPRPQDPDAQQGLGAGKRCGLAVRRRRRADVTHPGGLSADPREPVCPLDHLSWR